MTRRKLFRELSKFDNGLTKERQEIAGVLGIPLGGEKVVQVATRNSYVYVRLRESQNEVIQAFNDQVTPVYDLPVTVTREGGRYKVLGRDTQRYENWGSSSSYLPRHGSTHSFNPDGIGGGDVVWVYSRQFMPLLAQPSGTAGSAHSTINSNLYLKSDGTWRYDDAQTTLSLLAARPTDNQARMLLVYLDTSDGTLHYKTGTSFSASLTGTSDIAQYIPSLAGNTYEPIAAIRLLSGTTAVRWSNIYDVRQWFGRGGGITGSTVGVYDEAIIKGQVTSFDFVGPNVDVTVSGARARVFITGSTGGLSSVAVEDEGVSQGNVTTFNFLGDTVWANVTGTTAYIIFSGTGAQGPSGSPGATGPQGPTGSVGPQGPAGAGNPGVMVWDEGVPLGTGTTFDFVGSGVDATISGSVVRVFISGSQGPAGPAGTAGIVAWNEGIVLGTGTVFNFVGPNVDASISGSVVRVFITGSAGTHWFNVADYGALGDDSTNDYTAINNALTALKAAGGGVLYFPYQNQGKYRIGTTLTCQTPASRPNMHILGDEGVQIRPTADIDAFLFDQDDTQNFGDLNWTSKVIIENLIFNPVTTGQGTGIHLQDCYGVTIRSCRFLSLAIGINIETESSWSEGWVLDDVACDNCTMGIQFWATGGTGSFQAGRAKAVAIRTSSGGTGLRVGFGAIMMQSEFELMIWPVGASSIAIDIQGNCQHTTWKGLVDSVAGGNPCNALKIVNTASNLTEMDFRIQFIGNYYGGNEEGGAVSNTSSVAWLHGDVPPVIGPSSVSDGHLVVFDGTTGKKVKDGGASSAVTVLDTATIDMTLSGQQISADLKNTAAIAGSYTLPSVVVDAQGRLTAVANGAIAVYDDGVIKGSGTSFSFDKNLNVGITGSMVYVSSPVSTYQRFAQPVPLAGVTGTLWSVPDNVYASGSLGLFYNGLMQTVGINYEELIFVSGTYNLLFIPASDAVHMVSYGIPCIAQAYSTGTVPTTYNLLDSDTVSLLDSDGVQLNDSDG